MATLHKLKNGMEVLLEENHAAPVISYHILVKVGSVIEKPNEAGICHLIEHMLFKGTPNMPVGAIAKEVEAAGGEINAYTSFDQTVYFINMASRFKDRGLKILADAIQNPLFDESELEREKEVILEEIRRENDNPSHRVSELLFMKSYKRHPYKNPIIGNEKTVKAFTRKQILDFFKKWYSPKNITLVAVGEFNTDSILKTVENLFKNFKGTAALAPKIPKEPPSKKVSITIEENPINAAYFNLGFHIPDIKHEDIPALDVLSHVLAGTDSSRLEQVVKEEKQLVNAVYSYAFAPKHPGLFIVGGLATVEKVSKALTATVDEITKLYSTPIKTSELNRAKLNIRSSEIYEKETTSGQAGKYSYFMATAGTHDFEQKYYAQLQEVRVEDIMRVAQKYLAPENATLIIVPPKGSAKLINGAAIKSHLTKMKPSPKSEKKVKQRVAPPTIRRLSNGIKLIIQENHTLPLVSCAAMVYGGVRYENKANNGINVLLSQVITKGTKCKNAVQIAEAIESIAGSLSCSSGRNSFGVKSEFLSDKIDDGFGLFAEILTQPSFEPAEIEKERLQQLDAIKNQEDALTSLAYLNFMSALFPKHPYGLNMLGKKETVAKISRKNLIDYYHQLMNPRGMVVSVVGDVSPEEVVKMAENKLIFMPVKMKKFRAPATDGSPKKPITIEYKRPEKEQAHIVMGFLGPRIKSEDHYAIAVLNNILSGQGGRLFLKLRDQMSLAYAITSSYFAGIEPGYFSVYIGTDPSKIETAISGIKSELKSIITKGVKSEELDRSKNHIIGSHSMERQRNSALASTHALNVLFELGLNEIDEYPKKIEAITKNDVIKVAKKYLKMDAPVISVVRPE